MFGFALGLVWFWLGLGLLIYLFGLVWVQASLGSGFGIIAVRRRRIKIEEYLCKGGS